MSRHRRCWPLRIRKVLGIDAGRLGAGDEFGVRAVAAGEMIEAAGIARGGRVLEIRSGGYNAALLAEMTGPDGSVVTVDIDPWVTGRAARFLA